MSHIPAAAMPHAQAHGDDVDGQPPQPEQRQPAPGPNVASPPLASAAPATTSGNREGGDADRSARAAGAPASESKGEQPSVQGDERDRPGAQGAGDRSGLRRVTGSRAGVAALALGGVAAVAGIVVAALPHLREEQPPKGKKGKKRKQG